jgi:hypothetical protein
MYPLSALALAPVEGLILGEAQAEYQTDPLNSIFKAKFDTSIESEISKIKMYEAFVINGNGLEDRCSYLKEGKYATPWDEKQAQRSITASLQYIGLDRSIKAITAYARELKMSENEFNNLSENLLTNQCSQNITVYSIKLLRSSLNYYYKNPVMDTIPQIQSSPFVSSYFKQRSNTPLNYKNELNLAVRNFRAFCSWGNDVTDYRLMTPYLKNKYIMSWVLKNIHGISDKYDPKLKEVYPVAIKESSQVICNNLVCRKTGRQKFVKEFPKIIGSTGYYFDMQKLYCHHFRFQDPKIDTAPQVKKWLKESELEDPIFETNFFISLITGVPDPTFGLENYSDMQFVARSSFSDRWNSWAENVLATFSTGLLFEESIKVKPSPRRDRLALRTEGFAVDFTVTLGEMDRIMNDTDKFKVKFDLKLSKNYMRHLVTKWNSLSDQVDTEGQKAFKKDIAIYIDQQIAMKEKLFLQKMWNNDFSRLIADELLAQALAYRGPLFDSYKDELLTVPVNFSYGIFAISYLRYRSDVNAGRLKLNL